MFGGMWLFELILGPVLVYFGSILAEFCWVMERVFADDKLIAALKEQVRNGGGATAAGGASGSGGGGGKRNHTRTPPHHPPITAARGRERSRDLRG